eukprot:CAMPEP_0194529614 /NCGR_PEP_ID=MMETSP0253-20130528/66362_1 /TAXON_ID=2966 /ORGANISM="Noctiluca scintillans" /LENGTH=38 /DNA_ID= /DNA_START= /DNA_END= /DNA_ORIENTATION=
MRPAAAASLVTRSEPSRSDPTPPVNQTCQDTDGHLRVE